MALYKRTPISSIVKSNKNTLQEFTYPCFRRGPIVNHHFVGNGANRFYCVDHFWPTRLRHWLGNLFNQCVETVPYTKRKRFRLISNSHEMKMGKEIFDTWEAEKKVLPSRDPRSVRATSILKNIIEALQVELNKDRDVKPTEDHTWNALSNESRSNDYLVDLNWEVIVVRSRRFAALGLPGGKVILSTWLLKVLSSDAEIATSIGHEVAHAVAQHCVERRARVWFLVVLSLLLYPWISTFPYIPLLPYYAIIMYTCYCLVISHLERRMEREADYIGMMLIASAGYHPSAASKVHLKFDKLALSYTQELECFSSHPPNKERALLLAGARVMEQALVRYLESAA